MRCWRDWLALRGGEYLFIPSSYPVFGDYTGWAISLHEIYAVVGKMTTEPESTQLAAPATYNP
jgi:hypothetical protein